MSSINSIRAFARRLGVGNLVRLAVHRPIGLLRLSLQEGGPLEQRKTERGRLAMEASAHHLPTLEVPATDHGHRVYFLSGQRYWYQTLYCAYSLQLHAPERITPVVLDDGSLSEPLRQSITRAIPWAEFLDREAIEVRLDACLPRSKFPTLRNRRIEYPHIRKLTDVHAGCRGWRLVLDSDMLFFRQPAVLLSWLNSPDRPFHLVDTETAYGYPADVLGDLARAELPPAVNVGICGLRSDSLDWDEIERWCAALLERKGYHYLQEQALVAMMLAGKPALSAPAEDYIVLPDSREGADPRAVLHHYVAHSKRSYFQSGWRRIMSLAERRTALTCAA